MADAIVVYDVNINTQNAEKTIKMLGRQIAEIGTALTSAFKVGAIGSFATESAAAYQRIADAQNKMTKATSDGNKGLWDTITVAKGVIDTIKTITSFKLSDINHRRPTFSFYSNMPARSRNNLRDLRRESHKCE